LKIRRTLLITFAVLVAAFVALYPYLDSVGMCHSGECPQVVHSASSGFSTACMIVAVLAGMSVLPVVAVFGLRGVASELRPLQVFSSPDPPPPRLPQSR
jgi:hypothetical protein